MVADGLCGEAGTANSTVKGQVCGGGRLGLCGQLASGAVDTASCATMLPWFTAPGELLLGVATCATSGASSVASFNM